ncbi:MAG: YCF48-related protein [Ignavibacteria bacterium]
MNKFKIIAVVFILLLCTGAYPQTGWFQTTDTISNLCISSINFPTVETGYAACFYRNQHRGALYKTTNTGSTWQVTQTTGNSVEDIWFTDANTGFYAGANERTSFIYKTTNGGVNWTVKDSLYSIYAIKFFDSNTGIAVGKYGTSLKTTNGGENWFSLTNAGWIDPLSLICLSADTWMIGDDNIYKTTNGGINWSIMNFSGIGMLVYSLNFINSTTGFSATQNGKIFKTTNGGNNWTQISGLVYVYSFYGNICFVNENTGYLCAMDSGISLRKTTNCGLNWISCALNPFTHIEQIRFINNNTGFAGDTYGRIYKTTNGGSVFVANISSEVPDKFELGQNYPNPFNQSTIFNLQCSMKGNVSVKVFDAAGREVQTLVNETLAPGTYQIRFDGSGLASGLYYYSMSIDGKQTAVKKMVMVK